MRGIIVMSCTSSVVFHTAPFSRDVVDNIVAIVESDIHVKATSDGVVVAQSAVGHAQLQSPNSASSTKRKKATFQATLRKASLHRHGGQDLVHTAQWLEADHHRICEGLLCVYVAEHAWLGTMTREDGSECVMVLWRKCTDRVFIFVLDNEEPLSLARNAMSNLILLMCEAFDKPGSDAMPSLKDLVSRPDLVQASCSCVAPQHVLAMVPLSACRSMLQRLLLSKGRK